MNISEAIYNKCQGAMFISACPAQTHNLHYLLLFLSKYLGYLLFFLGFCADNIMFIIGEEIESTKVIYQRFLWDLFTLYKELCNSKRYELT